MGGIAGTVAAAIRPTVLRFDESYHNLYGLIHNAQVLDRPILADLPRAVWDSVALELKNRLADSVIEAAVGRLPAEWVPLEAEALAAKLRARRDALPEIAADLYRRMSTEVDVYGTDEADLVTMEGLADGSLVVRLSPLEDEDEPFFLRTFLPVETREVRVHLRGGADRATVSGSRDGIGVRVLGGGGDDILEDLTAPGSDGLTAFYDDRGDNELATGTRTIVDRREYLPTVVTIPVETNAPPPRDWGEERRFLPAAGWKSELGPIVGGGPSLTRFGFRRVPYAEHFKIAVLAAPVRGRFGVEGTARFIHTGSEAESRVNARVTQLSVTNFHGYGNERELTTRERRRVYATDYALGFELGTQLWQGLWVHAGPSVGWLEPETVTGSPARAPGVIGDQPYGLAGLSGAATWDARDESAYARRGFLLQMEVAGYPAVWGAAEEAFARGAVVGSLYLPLPGSLEPTLAMRAGGEQVWGSPPLQHAAYLGGSNLRGFRSQRYAGEALAFGSAELRAVIGRANLMLAAGDLGVLTLADVGRVFVSGEESNRWHSSAGGGVWFATLERSIAVHLLYAYGERHTFAAGMGLPF
jgi:hypothetical protein